MKFYFQPATTSSAFLSRLTLHSADLSTKGKTDGAATVNISQHGHRLSRASETGLDLSALGRVQTLDQLKDALKNADFHHMSPRETASVAGALDRTGQFDPQAVTDFFIALNTDEPLDQETKVDVVGHFNKMLDVTRAAAQTDPDFVAAVEIREQGSQLLNTLIDWTQPVPAR